MVLISPVQGWTIMRVGLLAHSARSGDAIGRQIAAKVAAFRERGDDVRLVVATEAGLDSRLRPFAVRYSGQKRESIAAWLRKCDLLLVEYSQHSPVLDLLPTTESGTARVIFDYHGVTPPALGAGGHRDALARGEEYRKLVWCADLAIVHSEFARRELQSATRFPAERIVKLGYPIEPMSEAPNRPCADWRARLGLAPATRLLLFVGRLAPNKSVPTLIQALDHLPASFHAVVIGDCGDAYEPERLRCRDLASRLRVAQRVHFLGAVDDSELAGAYRSADVLVVPSVHEGFCLPVIEAMAAGVPVMVARAAALPETLGDAGITFEPRNAADLASRVLRVLSPQPNAIGRRIAIVAQQFGDGIVGGAEHSLRALANRLRGARYEIQVFALGARDERIEVDGIPLHRFRADPGDADRLAAAAHVIQLANGDVDQETEAEFLDRLPQSERLIAAIRSHGPFDAIITGPYLSRLSHDVARAFPQRTVLAPCWHDEPAARLDAWRKAYRDIAGVLYHSPEERQFAQTTLGLNHPNAQVLGAIVPANVPGDGGCGRKIVGGGRRYLLLAGRRCSEKGFDRLLSYFRRYAEANPGRFTLAVSGGGNDVVPDMAGVRDLGYVTDEAMADVMAGAAALVHLSPNESLSLAVLQAQAQGVPVIVAAGNAVLEGHVRRGGGGLAVSDYESFAAALDDLWNDPDHWRSLGRRGREYVATRFGDAAEYDRRWRGVIDRMAEPLAATMTRNGRRRAAEFSPQRWRTSWELVIGQAMSVSRSSGRTFVTATSRLAAIEAERGIGMTMLPVRLTVHGDRPIPAEGPERWEIVCRVDANDGAADGCQSVTSLPGILIPGETVSALVRVPVPSKIGDSTVSVRVRPEAGRPRILAERLTIPLTVCAASPSMAPAVVSERLRSLLAGADGMRQLPDGYADVSLGRFARLKRWIKQKILHNFRTAYVDVLARQQSEFNRLVLASLAEINDVQTILLNAMNDSESARVVRDLQRRQRRLERKLRVFRTETETIRENAA